MVFHSMFGAQKKEGILKFGAITTAKMDDAMWQQNRSVLIMEQTVAPLWILKKPLVRQKWKTIHHSAETQPDAPAANL